MRNVLTRSDVPAAINDELLRLLEQHLSPGRTVTTVWLGRTNRIESISPLGIEISTEKSERTGGPQLVDGWMFNVAWEELTRTKRLRASELVRVAKRSSAVCAVLAALPQIDIVSERPVELRLKEA